MRQVLLCALLPAGAPDALERARKARQSGARLERQPMRRAIHQDGASRGRGDVVEPEEGEDAVDVHEQCGWGCVQHLLETNASLPGLVELKEGASRSDDLSNPVGGAGAIEHSLES